MSEQVEIVRRYLDGLKRLDAAAMVAEVAEDVALLLPFAPEGMPKRIDGKAAFEAFLAPVTGGLWQEIVFPTMDIRAEADPNRVIAEYTSRGTFANGQPYANTYANLFRLRDGKIVETAEFFDPVALTRGLAPAPAGG